MLVRRALGAAALAFASASFLTQALDVFDVVVVGSGPGGLLAAEFLSRDPKIQVLVLEAGGPSLQASGGMDVPGYASPKGFTKFDIPGEYDGAGSIFAPENAKYMIDYVDDRKLFLGQLVGGCSSLNAALYFRVPDAYITQTKWPFTPAQVQRRFDEMESDVFGWTDNPSPDGKRYVQEGFKIVARALTKHGGYKETKLNDVHARNHKDRTYGHTPFTIKDGLRDSPAKTCWGKMKTRPNVKLLTNARVNYIKQSKGKAIGVVYNNDKEVGVSARGAVIMAAGALGTPKVLIQSGIGPEDQLRGLHALPDGRFPGIKQSYGNNGDGWVRNANVGRGLFDTTLVLASFTHPQMQSFLYRNKPQSAMDQYMRDQTGPLSISGPVLISYEDYVVQARRYEFQMTVLTNGLFDSYSHPNGFTTALYINNPESRDQCSFDTKTGRYRAFTSNSLYMATNKDLLAMQNYTDKVVTMLTKEGATFVSKPRGQSLPDWVASNRGYVTHHFGGSCYVSKDKNDGSRCADDRLRVLGTNNIYVADASAMRDGTVNPYGFIMYTGREVGNLVKDAIAKGGAPGPNPPGPTQCSAFERDVDYSGSDMGEAPSTKPEDCCGICQRRSGCGAFTWTNHNSGTCWLKGGKGKPSAKRGAVSGTVVASSRCAQIEENVDYIGNDVGEVPSSTAEACCQICQDRRGCGAFTWTNHNGGTCWLKSAKGATTKTPGARSGVVRAQTHRYHHKTEDHHHVKQVEEEEEELPAKKHVHVRIRIHHH